MFAETTGEALDRESLVARLRSPEGAVQREAWIEQNARVIESLMAHVEKAIRAVSPSIKTGLMTAGPRVHELDSGSAFERWFAALGGNEGEAGRRLLRRRAADRHVHEGAGDGAPVRDTAGQRDGPAVRARELPVLVAGQVGGDDGKRMLAGARREAATAWRSSASGSADTEADFAAKMPMARAFADARPFWEQIVAKTQGLPLSGLWPAWHRRLMGRRNVTRGEDWFGFPELYDIGKPEALARLGLPMAAERGDGGVFLAGRVAEAFTTEQLREMLSGPVLMDAFALEVLAKRGLGELAGVRVHRLDRQRHGRAAYKRSS